MARYTYPRYTYPITVMGVAHSVGPDHRSQKKLGEIANVICISQSFEKNVFLIPYSLPFQAV